MITKKDIFYVITIYLFFFAAYSNAAQQTAIQKPRDIASNYVDVEFQDVMLSEVMFFVADVTGQPFILSAKEEPITWVQTRIYKDDLITQFKNVLSTHSIITQQAGRAIVVTNSNAAVSSATDSVGYYKLKHLKADVLKDTSEILYKNRLAINPLADSKIVLFSGDPQDVKQFFNLIHSVDTPNETDLNVIRVKHVSVKSAIKALQDTNKVKEVVYYPDYWNRSVIVKGDDYQRNVAAFIIHAVDQPQQGYVDQLEFLSSITPETVAEVLQGQDVEVRTIAEDRVLLSGLAAQVEKAQVLLHKIDGAGLQVKIEAVVAYLTDKEFQEIGIRLKMQEGNLFATLNDPIFGNTATLLSESFEDFFRLDINATDNEAEGKIVSSPVLTVLNGKTARLHVGRNVPYLSEANYNEYDGETIGTSIQRQDVGVTFNVTPIISPDGQFVNVKLDQIISNITPGSELGQAFADIVIDKQEITSEIKVADGQTIFLGGLRVDEQGKSQEKIPLLSSIPVLGKYLFTYNADQLETRNLIVSLRVRVLNS